MMILRLFIITFLAILFHLPASAQSGENDPQNSLLPDINPQDIEIRSEFQARFPGLRRQPILGFNPKPRVFRIDPDRMPFMESRDDAVAGIEVTNLDRPEPPVRNIFFTPDRMNAYVRAGLGTYLTPEIDAYGFTELGESSLISADMNFRSSDGHLENQESGFRFFDVQALYRTKTSEKWQSNLEVGVLSDEHHLLPLPSIDEMPEKNNLGASAKATIKQINNAFSGMDFVLGGSLFQSRHSTERADYSYYNPGGEISETIYFGKFRKYWPGQRMYETFDISTSIEGGNYQVNNADSENWMHVQGALEYERLLDFTTRIKGKGGIDYISDPYSDKFYFVPEVEVKHNINNNFSATANFFAKPELQSVQSHHQYNRFLNNRTQLRHSYNIGIHTEVAFKIIEGNSLYGGITYDHIRDYAYYQRDEIFATDAFGLYDVNYGDANILELYAGISQQLVPEKFWFDAKLYGRNPSLKDGDKIPYEERMGLEGSLSYKPFNKLTISSWAEYVGPREDPASADDLNAFALINGSAEFQINERFGVYAKVLNILGQKYEIWNGYQERPFQVFGGLTIKI
ncbi:MAG: hypothetical protein WD059_03685 [Balneolaceae bacterium]